jgi:hypothetical protein
MSDEFSEKEIADHEKEIAQVTGGMHEGFDIFAGSDPGDSQRRRFERLEFHESDMTDAAPDLTDSISNYNGPRTASEIRNPEQHRVFLEHQEAVVKEKFPDYSEVVTRYLEPLLPQLDPVELRKFLLRDDAAEASYKAAKKIQRQWQSKAPTQEEIDSMDGEAFEARLKDWVRSAQSSDDEDRGAFVTRSEMRQMAQMNAEDFEKALNFVKGR